MIRYTKHIILGILFACMIVAAHANEEQQEQSIDFQDWKVVCSVLQDGKKTCQMLQSAKAIKEGPIAFLLTISNNSEDHSNYAVITVPIGVYLANGIQIRINKKRPFKVLYEVCSAKGCHAGFKLSNNILNSFKKGNAAKIYVWTSRKKAIEFKISLAGFTKAINYLMKAQ